MERSMKRKAAAGLCSPSFTKRLRVEASTAPRIPSFELIERVGDAALLALSWKRRLPWGKLQEAVQTTSKRTFDVGLFGWVRGVWPGLFVAESGAKETIISFSPSCYSAADSAVEVRNKLTKEFMSRLSSIKTKFQSGVPLPKEPLVLETPRDKSTAKGMLEAFGSRPRQLFPVETTQPSTVAAIKRPRGCEGLSSDLIKEVQMRSEKKGRSGFAMLLREPRRPDPDKLVAIVRALEFSKITRRECSSLSRYLKDNTKLNDIPRLLNDLTELKPDRFAWIDVGSERVFVHKIPQQQDSKGLLGELKRRVKQ